MVSDSGKKAGREKALKVFTLQKDRLGALALAIKPSPKVPFGGKFGDYGGKIDLSANLTMIPPVKKYFLPDGGAFFKFNPKSQKIAKREKREVLIILGVNPLDILALETLDKIFGKTPAYSERRKASLVIGAGDYAKSGRAFDIFLHDNGMSYIAIEGSLKGKKFLSKYKKFFIEREISPEEIPKPEKRDTILLDPEKLREKIKNAPKQVWADVARTCLGCGICSYVCPLCYCFEVEDKVPIGSSAGERCSRWDSCMLESFSEVAGGHVFQKALPERIRNWYTHKFSRAVSERGLPDCVGCDRCFHFCPVAINFREVLKKC